MGIVDLVTMKARIWRDDSLGAKYDDVEIPEIWPDQAKEYHDKLVEAVSESDDASVREIRRRRADHGRRAARGYPQGDHRAEDFPGGLRHGVQEQGRAEHAGRGGGLPAVAARCSADEGHRRRRQDKEDRPQAGRHRAVFGAGLQDHDRPVCRPAGVHSRLFGQAQLRANRFTTSPRAARSASGVWSRCTPTSAKTSRKFWRAISARRWV